MKETEQMQLTYTEPEPEKDEWTEDAELVFGAAIRKMTNPRRYEADNEERVWI